MPWNEQQPKLAIRSAFVMDQHYSNITLAQRSVTMTGDVLPVTT